MPDRIIVWDFDGVLNANVVDGRFIWADRLEEDWGIDTRAMVAHLFDPGRIGQIMRGQIDLGDALAQWFTEAGHQIDVEAFLAYWFARDAHPDFGVMAHLNRPEARHVIGTNNEARRADYIEREMGFGARVERIFASGRLGCAKPAPAYFDHIEAWSGAAAEAHVLIDDTERNVAAALDRGWHGFHFTDANRSGLGAFLDQLP
ncbi:HAD family hydrolase [Tateyamaria sp.]|uniref:HAD family hydrolase n=1 Tax=Tateyamaria sp. TaxID=1929288 RepID=UPI003B224DA7